MTGLILTGVRVLVDSIFGFAIYALYGWGVRTGTALFHVDFWFTRFTFGIIGVSFALLAFSWAKNVAFYFLKCCDVYLAMNKNCSGIKEVASGVMSRFGSVVAVPVFNYVIRSIVGELSGAVHSAFSVSGEGDIANSFISRVLHDLDGSLMSRIMKCGKTMLRRTFDYVDECVLGYCFSNSEKKLSEAAPEALVLFVKNLGVLLPKMFTVNLMVIIMRYVFYAVGFVIAVTMFGSVTLDTLIPSFLMMKAISFVIEDAVLEPTVLRSIVGEFAGLDVAEIDDGVEGLAEFLPSMQGLDRVKH